SCATTRRARTCPGRAPVIHHAPAPPALAAFFMCRYHDLRDTHSFPTRRSSDLCGREGRWVRGEPPLVAILMGIEKIGNGIEAPRSEEHTSELQSRSDLVCRLAREKKKEIAGWRPVTSIRVPWRVARPGRAGRAG